MKTLYVSDLDGTLLRSDERTSAYTNCIIGEMAERGMLFSYATARSYHTARRATAGLDARIPLIVYNGAMIVSNEDGAFLKKNFFGQDAAQVLDRLRAHGITPIVYAFVDGEEKFSYIPQECTAGMRAFIGSRAGDRRNRAVRTWEELSQGEIFYITCIDEEEKLAPLYEQYRGTYHCVFHRDVYTGDPWLEIMPEAASKAHAIAQLKEQLCCERLVVFGDGKNDVDMFELADEAYAVGNAVPELKAIATGVIGCCDEDGVAKWLEENAL